MTDLMTAEEKNWFSKGEWAAEQGIPMTEAIAKQKFQRSCHRYTAFVSGYKSVTE